MTIWQEEEDLLRAAYQPARLWNQILPENIIIFFKTTFLKYIFQKYCIFRKTTNRTLRKKNQLNLLEKHEHHESNI